jgi:prepilin-type N-terminal cleavage/methylation domain-containing protein
MIRRPLCHSARPRPAAAFTLIELLVVMTIIAVLSAGLFAGIAGVRRQGQAAAASKNLKQLASAFQEFALEKKRYPEAIDQDESSGGGTWAWQIRDYLGINADINTWPPALVLAPRHGDDRSIMNRSENERRNLVHYAASLVVCPEVQGGSNTGKRLPYVRITDVMNPSTTALLGDAPLRTPDDPASGSSPAWRGLTAEAMKGDPNQPVPAAQLQGEMDFWLSNKALVLFVDGRVDKLRTEDITKRMFQLDP